MSANNYIKIEEVASDKFRVAEKDCESDLDIQYLGNFDFIRLAVEKAEKHINDSEYGVEYGIRFSLTAKNPSLVKKDFQKWHTKKLAIDQIEKRPFFHEGEIWWCTLGMNVGFEQDGGGEDYLRPVIVYKKFNNEVFWAIPLTHTDKQTRYYFQLTQGEDSPKSTAILSQIRLVDARRLSHKLENNVSKEDFSALTEKFKALLP